MTEWWEVPYRFRLLGFLDDEGPHTALDIGKALGLTRVQVRDLISKLEPLGVVLVCGYQERSNAYKYDITDKGRQQFRTMLSNWQDFIRGEGL